MGIWPLRHTPRHNRAPYITGLTNDEPHQHLKGNKIDLTDQKINIEQHTQTHIYTHAPIHTERETHTRSHTHTERERDAHTHRHTERDTRTDAQTCLMTNSSVNVTLTGAIRVASSDPGEGLLGAFCRSCRKGDAEHFDRSWERTHAHMHMYICICICDPVARFACTYV